MLNLKNKNILSISDLSKQEIIHILTVANQIKKHPKSTLLNNYIMGSCFFEPSTRTRLSFETAMLRLGGQVVGFSESGITSVKKGEALSDAIKVIGDYVDVIVIRHSLEGAVRHGAEATNVPVINGGDGANQHPTQTLLDLFTIKECQKRLNGLKVALVGDLKYGRTVHSLTQALMYFNPRFYFVAPSFLQMPDYLKSELKKKKIMFSIHDKIEEVVNDVDILYMTRIQKERFADPLEYEQMKNIFVLTADSLSRAKNNLRIMHPLPRVNEIAKDVDKTKYAYYFQQAKNGVYVRQALLGLVLGKFH